jgi:hypothetical protein
MQKEIEAGRWRGQDKEGAGAKEGADGKEGAAAAARPVPKPYMSAQYREDSMRTTGALPVMCPALRAPATSNTLLA